MTWLITGGTGQLGTALSWELTKRGLPYQSFGSKELDVTQNESLNALIEEIAPRVIINCAAWTDVDGAEASVQAADLVNRFGAKNIAIAAKKCSAKLVHISTDYVFSGEKQEPWQEETVKNPQSSYGRTKADGEDSVLTEYPESSLVVRTAWLYSPWGKNFAKTMTRLALEGKSEVRVVNDQCGQPTSATDLANQIISLVLTDTSNGIYHGTNSGEATWFDFAREIFTILNEDLSRVVPVSSSEYPQSARRPSYSVLGHVAWKKAGVPPMRDWRHALAEAMPEIVYSIKTIG